MLTRLLRLIGVGEEILVRLDQAVLVFHRPGLLWLGLALLLPVGYFIVRRQRTNLATASPRLRRAEPHPAGSPRLARPGARRPLPSARLRDR